MIFSGTNYFLSGFRFYDNQAAGGGGAGTMTSSAGIMENCKFEMGRATHVQGGAIFVEESATTLISRTLFMNNYAVGGGAIFVEVKTGKPTGLTLQASTFQGNTAGDGGSIFAIMDPALKFVIENCTFTERPFSVHGQTIETS